MKASKEPIPVHIGSAEIAPLLGQVKYGNRTAETVLRKISDRASRVYTPCEGLSCEQQIRKWWREKESGYDYLYNQESSTALEYGKKEEPHALNYLHTRLQRDYGDRISAYCRYGENQIHPDLLSAQVQDIPVYHASAPDGTILIGGNKHWIEVKCPHTTPYKLQKFKDRPQDTWQVFHMHYVVNQGHLEGNYGIIYLVYTPKAPREMEYDIVKFGSRWDEELSYFYQHVIPFINKVLFILKKNLESTLDDGNKIVPESAAKETLDHMIQDPEYYYVRQKGQCAKCRQQLDYVLLTKNHIVLKNQSRENGMGNRQLLCVSCYSDQR